MNTKEMIYKLRTKRECRRKSLQKKVFASQGKRFLVGKTEKPFRIQKP